MAPTGAALRAPRRRESSDLDGGHPDSAQPASRSRRAATGSAGTSRPKPQTGLITDAEMTKAAGEAGSDAVVGEGDDGHRRRAWRRGRRLPIRQRACGTSDSPRLSGDVGMRRCKRLRLVPQTDPLSAYLCWALTGAHAPFMPSRIDPKFDCKAGSFSVSTCHTIASSTVA